MIKKFLGIFVSLIALAYITYSIIMFSNVKGTEVCKKINIYKQESSNDNFIKTDDISQRLMEKGLFPLNKKLDYAKVNKIERCLRKMNFVKRAECYRTNNGNLVVTLWQRHPILHVITEYNSYYIDQDRKRMPTSKNFTSLMPIVSGCVTESFAKKELYDFVVFLSKDEFWNAHIDQIYVLPNKKIELVPKIGTAKVMLGTIDNYEKKMEKLSAFYKAYPEYAFGDKYETINLEYNKLIYGTLKKTTAL